MIKYTIHDQNHAPRHLTHWNWAQTNRELVFSFVLLSSPWWDDHPSPTSQPSPRAISTLQPYSWPSTLTRLTLNVWLKCNYSNYHLQGFRMFSLPNLRSSICFSSPRLGKNAASHSHVRAHLILELCKLKRIQNMYCIKLYFQVLQHCNTKTSSGSYFIFTVLIVCFKPKLRLTIFHLGDDLCKLFSR